MNYAYTYDMRVLAIAIAILWGILSWFAFPAPAKAALVLQGNPQSAMTGVNSYTIPTYVGTSTEATTTEEIKAIEEPDLKGGAPVEEVDDRSTRIALLRELIKQLEALLAQLKEKGI